MADLLIVDDNVDLAELLGDFFASEGHRVRIAHDGEAGMLELGVRLPDLVILDVDMPVLDGPGMAYRMLVENCGKERIPIVLLSGNPDLPAVARRVGTRYVLPKPCCPERLQSVVARSLVERASPRPRA
jgi:CheY-like chemotaxis protein